MFYDCPSRYGKKSMRKENSGLFFCQQKTNSRQKMDKEESEREQEKQ